ncbi:hypothetical protein KA977_01690 [Candidatus Dependentiae bacterium]|nr:hypothetical protein [Candidatus Dependentiae bacterium]
MLLSAAGFAVYLTKGIDFPFITMRYIQNKIEFNSFETINYNMPVSEYSSKYIKKYFEKINISWEKEEDVIFVINEFVRKHLKPENNDLNSLDDIFITAENGSEYNAICSGYSQLTCAVAQTLGFKSRVIWMRGHTVSEIYFEKTGWIMIDTNGNLMFKNKNNGLPGCLIDIIFEFENFIPVRISNEMAGNDYDYIKMKNTWIYRNNPVIVVIENSNLLSFTSNSRNPVKVLQYLFGKEIANGIQFFHKGGSKLGNQRYNVIIFLFWEILLAASAVIIFLRKRRV